MIQSHPITPEQIGLSYHKNITPEALAAFTERFPVDRLQQNVTLAPHTTFKIGGNADLFFVTRTAFELSSIVSWAREYEIPMFLLGVGANIIFGDGGFRGLVVKNEANHILVDGNEITAESGAIVYPNLIEVAIENNLSGLEHYAGIPSTVGGAMWQNLHFLSPDRNRTMFISEVVKNAEILTEDGNHISVDNDYFNFGYDYSTLHDTEDIVLTTTFALTPAKAATMRTVVEDNLEWRSARHPPLIEEPSVGSIFKKIEGIGAGRLIERAGLKGKRIGGIEITHRHANIFVNRGNGTAADVRALIRLVQETVLSHSGYSLETEVAFVGEFPPKLSPPPEQYDINGERIG